MIRFSVELYLPERGRGSMTVVTRFAPSPTGFLHIGGARTALFNWLYARHHGGTFRLRIEDTDRVRSTEEAVQAILDGLTWLGLEWDDAPMRQYTRVKRHTEIAYALLADDKAYQCYCTPEELADMREAARAAGRPMRYNGRWRDRDPSEAPPGAKPVIRFKAPRTGETAIDDQVQGEVRTANEQLDDMVLLRADGTPTYMLAVVVDDHDTGITHAIRGDAHLTNAFRQVQLFWACGWTPPVYAHIPLIHGADGAKLSKRHGAVALDAYQAMGILPEAMRNYLLRLGWSHGDDEVISTAQAIEWFELDTIGRSPARFDPEKLLSLNAHYMREATDQRLMESVAPVLAERIGRRLDEADLARLGRAMPGLKFRAKTLVEISENAMFLFQTRPLAMSDKAARLLTPEAHVMLARLRPEFDALDDWNTASLEHTIRRFSEQEGMKLGKIAQPLRAALTGSTVSPGIFDVLDALERAESLARIDDILKFGSNQQGAN
jgi:glutamyl-tRNA synthetase